MFRLTRPLFLLLILLGTDQAAAQPSLFIPADDPVYSDIQRAIYRGFLTDLNPTARPWTYSEVLDALPKDVAGDPLLERIRDGVSRFAASKGAGYTGRAGLRMTSNGRLETDRVLAGDDWLYPYLESGLHWIDGPVIARAAFRFDTYWDVDPDGLDSVLRAYMRNDQSYVGYSAERGSVHLGRIATRWGSRSALIVSDNPRSYDALHLRLGSRKLSFRSIIGELDSITGDGRFTGTAGDDSVASGSERRWMAAHRFDWRPRKGLQISIQEAVLFSGAGTGPSLKYLNPTQFLILAVDNRPKNDENNGMVAAAVWAQTGPWTIESQLLFDDFDLLMGDEEASFAASLDLTRVFRPDLLAFARTEIVASRTYNTFQPEGRWTYLQRGIATQFSDYVVGEVGASWELPGRGLRLDPYALLVLQGERDLRDPYRFDDTFETILVGVVERTLRTAARIRYDQPNLGYVALDAGLNFVNNEGHMENASRTVPVATLEVGLRWSISGSRTRR
ncbi:MAG: hypothetical protein HKN29_06380 [Rhodothermales bacterium]|nr:hypothetical protein [Rhodothermales bacterium]